jgi:hypothetical protein
VPFSVLSTTLVAVIVTVSGVGRIAGAVYIPFASIVPIVAFPPTTEFTAHVTLLRDVSLDSLPLVAPRGLLSGLIERPVIAPVVVVPGFVVPLVVPPVFVPLDVPVPVELVLVVPADELPVVAVLMVAANASWDPARTVAVAGATVTPELLPLSGVLGEPSLLFFEPRPEQPLRHNTRSTACALQIRFTDMPPMNLVATLRLTPQP